MLRFIVLTCLIALLFSYGCGKKGPPTLKDYYDANHASKNVQTQGEDAR